MKRAAEILGLPVVNLESGEIIGKVDDIIFIPELKEITGLVIANENKYFLQRNNIKKIGEDAVVIKNREELTKFDDLPGMTVNQKENSVIGETVITTSGEEIGLINDLVIDENEQVLIGYEMSEGIIQDLFEGRNVLPIDENLSYGKDALILKKDKEG